jgi:hypothetical protein
VCQWLLFPCCCSVWPTRQPSSPTRCPCRAQCHNDSRHLIPARCGLKTTDHFLQLRVTSLPTTPPGLSHRLHPSPVLTSSWPEWRAFTGGRRWSPAPPLRSLPRRARPPPLPTGARATVPVILVELQPTGRLPHRNHHPWWSSSRALLSPRVSCPSPCQSTAIPAGLDSELPALHRPPSPIRATAAATGRAEARVAVPPTGHHLHAAHHRAISHP